MMTLCKECGWRVAEYGATICLHCKAEKKAKEKAKPKETVDDIACKARKMGLTYGKYLAMRQTGQIKEEEDE